MGNQLRITRPNSAITYSCSTLQMRLFTSAVWSGGVEPALLKPALLLGRDLDVGRREQEDLVGDPLHLAAESVGEPAGEVDEAAREVAVAALEVHDDRLVHLQLVADLLGIVEPAGGDDVNLGGLRGDRPHDCGSRQHRGRVDGLTRQRAHHARLGLAAGHRGTAHSRCRRRRRGRLHGRLFLVRVVVLVLVVVDEAEVHSRSSPHRCHGPRLLVGRAYRRALAAAGRGPKSARPIRTIVAPSSTATSRSSDIPMERSSRPTSSASAATRRKPRRASSGGPAGPTAMRPRTSRPAARSCSTRPGTSGGGHPPFWGSPVTSTWTSTAAPGARRAMALPTARRSTPCHSATSVAMSGILLRW